MSLEQVCRIFNIKQFVETSFLKLSYGLEKIS